jgi:diphthine synthase
MLYIIGLGLGLKGISLEGLEEARKCKKIYLENYTVDLPYSKQKLEEVIDKKIQKADREFVEGMEFVDYAAKQDVALLVYGSPLTATTHITILDECRKSGIKCRIIHGSSVFDGVAETGLQLYKFGKISSMPDWKDKGESTSFADIIKENHSIQAHTLILIDIGLPLKIALRQLKKSLEEKKFDKILNKKIVVCSKLGGKSEILYDYCEKLSEKRVKYPYCIIIPGKLHFLEQEVLESFI